MSWLRRVIARPGLGLVVGVILVTGAVGLGLVPSLHSRTARSSASPTVTVTATGSQVANLPAPPTGFAIPKPSALGDPAGESRWALVIRATSARLRPSAASPVVNEVSTRTPEGTANLVLATGEVTRGDQTWVRASLPSLHARDTEGWVPRDSLGGWSFVDVRAVVDRQALTLTLFRGGLVIFRAPVGIGTPNNPTPAGTFYVRDRLTGFASPAYGPLAFGTSARAPYLTGWPDGGYIGIHGTNEPSLIPGRISHGCIRLTNADIERLGRLMPVGTPVTVK